MNVSAKSTSTANGANLYVWLALSLVVCCVAVSWQSLWIDETLTAYKASQPSLSQWWQTLLADRASDAQMPFYMLYIWAWAKVVGTSEWALRAANIPWFLAGLLCLLKATHKSKNFMLGAVMLLSPFAWYYLDEARPYAMQFGTSLMIAAAFYGLRISTEQTRADEKFWWIILWTGIVCLSGSSLLGMIWAGGACLGLLALFGRKPIFSWSRKYWMTSVLAVIVLLFITAYYVWTLKAGARASDVGKTDARNVLFIAYELFGLSGLGPGRLQIRATGLNAMTPYAVQIIIYAFFSFVILISGLKVVAKKLGTQNCLKLSAAIFLPAMFILAAGYIKHFRVLGRHFTPMAPVILGIIAIGLHQCLHHRNWRMRAAVYWFFALSLVSCLSLRLSARHAKDDYRDAANIAKAAFNGGYTVWWSATSEGAVYYQVPLSSEPQSRARLVINPDEAMLDHLPMPDVVTLSKPEIHDVAGNLTRFLETRHYRMVREFPAFTIWKAPQSKFGGAEYSSAPN